MTINKPWLDSIIGMLLHPEGFAISDNFSWIFSIDLSSAPWNEEALISLIVSYKNYHQPSLCVNFPHKLEVYALFSLWIHT